MKKHLSTLLCALALIGAGAVWAATTPELTTTDIHDGQRIYLSAQWIETVSEENPDGLVGTPYYLGVITPSSTPDTLAFSTFTDATPGDSYTFTLEAAGFKIQGIDAYYIRNDFSGKYLHKTENEVNTCADIWLTDKSQATAWAIFKAADHTDLTGYSGRDIPDEAIQIMAPGTDGTPYYITYNGIFSAMFKKMYPDMFYYIDETMTMTTCDAQTWFMMETVATQEDPYEEMRAAVAAAIAAERPAGTDPGFYSPELMDNLHALINEANELMDAWEATDEQLRDMTERLNAAVEQVVTAKANPVRDGYYYVVNGAYDLNAIGLLPTEETPVTKLAIRDDERGVPTWHRLDTTDPAYVWQITQRTDGRYNMQNLLTGLYLDEAENSNTIAMSETSSNGIDLRLLGTQATFALNMYDRSAKEYTSIYAYNYSQRALYDTDGSTLMLRSSLGQTAGSWYLNAIPEDVLAELLANAPTIQLRNQLTSLIARGSGLYAAAVAYEPGANLITDASQLESNAGMGPESEWGEDGGGLAALIDQDAATFFHTAWTDNIPTETITDAEGLEQIVAQKHWLAITLPEATDQVSLVFTRRAPHNDCSPADFDLFGSNDEVNWTTILTGYNDFDPTQADVTIIPNLKLGAKYHMLRMVVNHTSGTLGHDRKSEGGAIYWNLAELKVCGPVQLAPNCQAVNMPEDVVNGLAHALGLARNALANPTQADIETLQQAITAFLAEYVDAEPLLALIREAEQVNNNFETGTGLGYYTEGTTNTLPQLIEQARTVVETTAYTAATLDQQTTLLSNALATLQSAMQQTPDPTKYYTIHFPGMEEYSEYGWETTEANSEATGNYLFGKQAVIATSAYEQPEANAVRSGAMLYFVNPEEVADEEMAQFRFVPQTDGTYLVQNRATGLYLHGSNGGYAPLTLAYAPSLVRVKGLGHGKIQLDLADPDGTAVGNLYAQLYDTRLSLSTLQGLGSNGALELHEVESETVNEEDIETAPMDIQIGKYYAMCYPLNVTSTEGQMYTVAGLVKQGDDTYVGLKEVDHVKAGEPFVFVMHLNDIAYTSTPTAEDSLSVEINFGQELAAQPAEVGGLQGSYVSRLAAEGETVLLMNKTNGQPQWTTIQKKSTYDERLLNTYSAVLPDWSKLPVIAEADLLIALTGADTNGIEDIETNGLIVVGNGIYDLQGRKVSENAVLTRGIYIKNGKKIIRK